MLAVLPFWAALSKIKPFLPQKTVLSRFCRNRAILAKLHSFQQRFKDLSNFWGSHCLKDLLQKKKPVWPRHTVLSRFCQNNAVLAILQFWAALFKIKPFLPWKTVLSRFCQNEAIFAKLHSFERCFPDLSNFGQNHCLKELLRKKKPFWPKHTVLSRFCQNNAILAILPFWAALSEIQPFLPEDMVLSRSKSSNLPHILFKMGKQCAFHENCTKPSFQVMSSTFWPNRIFERQSSQNRHTGLKFSPKRENSALFIKIVQTLFSGHAQYDLAKSHFWASKLSKSSHWPQILSKKRKQCALHENCTKRSFQVMRNTFWPNRIFEGQTSQNRHHGVKFSPKRENSALFMKIVQTLFSGHAKHDLAKPYFWASKLSKSSHWPQILSKKRKQCAFHENCIKRFFQVMRCAFWPNRIFEGQTSQNRHHGLKFSPKRENSALYMKIVQTLFSGHAKHVLAKSQFWASKLS